MPVAEKNKKNMNAMDTYAEVARYVLLDGGEGDGQLINAVQMLDSTFLMTTEMTIDEIMFQLRMLAISLWILENGMYHTTYGS